MQVTEKTESLAILTRNLLTDEELELVREAVLGDFAGRQRIKETIARILSDDSSSHAARVKAAFVMWLIGGQNPEKVLEEHFQDSEIAAALYIRILLSSDALDKAQKALNQVLPKKGGPVRLRLLRAELAIRNKELSAAQEELSALAPSFPPLAPQTAPDADPVRLDRANFLFLQGYLKEQEALAKDAIPLYEEALKFDKNHLQSHFRLAYNLDLYGDDEGAIHHYEEARRIRPLYLSVLMNLGVLYEDMGRYVKAIPCYQTVLDADPSHERASLFLKDAEASQTMVYDEEQKREQDKLTQILSTPISDFELSVRSRNCLAKMQITTLGELSQKTELELLSYKNFGETSLREIKQLLGSKSLSLGMSKEQLAAKRRPEIDKEILEKNKDKQDVLRLPVSQLELSARPRACLEKAHITTIGELISKTPEELLSVKNFGQVSLNEIRQKLAKYGLSLKES
jgi:DNA-directed RNA polymerase subunit alpha